MEGLTGCASDPAAGLALEALPYWISPHCQQLFCTPRPWPVQVLHSTRHHDRLCTVTMHNSALLWSILPLKSCPMFNTTSVPLRLDLLHLAIGSTSLKVQPHGTDFPSLNSAAGGTQGVEERLLRHNWSKGEHRRGTETTGKWHQWEECRKEGESVDKITEVRKRILFHTQARK